MIGRVTGSHRVAAALTIAVLSGLSLVAPTATWAAGEHVKSAPVPAEVTMKVLSVNPSTPVPEFGKHLLTITLALTNNTDLPIRRLAISADRGDPINRQQYLNVSLAGGPQSVDPRPIVPLHPVTVNLPAEVTNQPVSFQTITSKSNGYPGRLCLCANAIYPIDLEARVTAAGVAKTVATTRTYIPAFDSAVKPIQVSWVWPLIDRPHRIGDGSKFIDDDLASEVSTNGRLDRALRVIERVGPTVPITVVVDPELLDELEVMSTGNYTVRASSTSAVPGIGQAVATRWLSRFTQMTADPGVTVDLTPYADPDVQTLARHGLSWSNTMPRAMAKRVATALGGSTAESDVAWPTGGVVDRAALADLVQAGAKTVLLDRTSVAPREVDGIPSSLARLASSAGTVTAALTSPAIQADVRSVVTLDGTGSATLPELVSELAVRLDPTTPPVKQAKLDHFVLLTPPRYVDPAPGPAVRAILDTTTRSPFSIGVSLGAVTTSNLVPKTASRLRSVPTAAIQLPADILSQTQYSASSIDPVSAMLSQSRPAQRLVASLPWVLQQSESAGWRSDSDAVGGPALGVPVATRLRRQIENIRSSVQVLNRSASSYTLASRTSKLPLTVQNTSRYLLRVHIDVRVQNGLPGFRNYSGNQLIRPDRKQTVHIPTQVDRSGRYAISVQLSTPPVHGVPGEHLGRAIPLNVHSTALGTIGVVITVVAGVVLLLALLIRYIRRIRRIRGKRRKNVNPAARSTSSTALPEPAS